MYRSSNLQTANHSTERYSNHNKQNNNRENISHPIHACMNNSSNNKNYYHNNNPNSNYNYHNHNYNNSTTHTKSKSLLTMLREKSLNNTQNQYIDLKSNQKIYNNINYNNNQNNINYNNNQNNIDRDVLDVYQKSQNCNNHYLLLQSQNKDQYYKKSNKSNYNPNENNNCTQSTTLNRNKPQYQIQLNKRKQQKSQITLKKTIKQEKLKILTESDLNDNQSGQNQSNYQENYDNTQTHNFKDRTGIHINNKNQNTSVKQITISKTNINRQPSQQSENLELNQQHQFSELNFTFLPNTKLEIKNYVPSSYQPNIKTDASLNNNFKNHQQSISLSSLINKLKLNNKKISTSDLKYIPILTITNCSLSSLQGIQVFQNLQQVNLRNNNLTEIQQLHKIPNKHFIKIINIQGNDIEHYHLARYNHLKLSFQNLEQLNNKNYSLLMSKDKRRKEQNDMNKLIKKSTLLEIQFKKSLQRQKKFTEKSINKYLRMASQTKDTELNLLSVKQQGLGKCQSQQIQQLSVSENKHNQQNQKYDNNQHYSLGQNMLQSGGKNQTILNIEQKNIFNVPLTKSVLPISSVKQHETVNPILSQKTNRKSESASQIKKNYKIDINKTTQYPQQIQQKNYFSKNQNTHQSQCEQQNNNLNNNNHKLTNNQHHYQSINQIPLQTTVPISRGLLQIKTEDLQEEEQFLNHANLHQPTATFAMQIEKQNQYAKENKQFMFKNNKNNNKNDKYQQTSNSNNNWGSYQHNFKSKKNQQEESLISHQVSRLQRYQQAIQQCQGSEQQCYQDQLGQKQQINNKEHSMSISRISEIPTKRPSQNQNNNNEREKNTLERKSLQLNNNRNKNPNINTNYRNDFCNDGFEPSFLASNTPNQYFGINDNNKQINYSQMIYCDKSKNSNNLITNRSYMQYSRFSQYRPNQSMDEDCLLKQNKDGLEEEKLAIATAIYLRNLVTKALFALHIESNKRKNLPKKTPTAVKFFK